MHDPIVPSYIPRLLIVDDEKYNIEFLQIVLCQYGYEVASARSGAEGRRKAEEFKPDLILLDIMMPAESGYETCSLLKQNPETCHIPIIFLTALDDRKNFTRGLDAGASDFIAKPFEYREVLNRIRIHLKLFLNSRQKKFIPDQPENKLPDTFTVLDNICIYDEDEAKQNSRSFCEVSYIGQGICDILLLDIENDAPEFSKDRIRTILSACTGPHFIPAESLRDIGFELTRMGLSVETEAKLIHLDSANEIVTVANAGGAPVIHMNQDNIITFIEPQTAGLYATGQGFPPCSTHDFKDGHRLIACTSSFLSNFKNIAIGTRELQNTVYATAHVDIKTACEAIGRTISTTGAPAGRLAVIEK